MSIRFIKLLYKLENDDFATVAGMSTMLNILK